MTKAEPFAGWRMVAICFLILNCTLGVNFAAYGAMVEVIERTFSTSRALASMGLSMLTLALGLLAPLVGILLRHVSIRTAILAGIAMNAAGFAALTLVHGIFPFLAIYGLLIGPGFALAGVVPCTAIISNWFVEGRGKALGIINMPLGNAVMPLLAAAMVVEVGFQGALLCNAAILAALLVPAMFLADTPTQMGQRAKGHIENQTVTADGAMSTGQILRSMPFLVITLGVSLLSAAGIVMVTHLVALASDRGLPLTQASLLLSVFGLAGLMGAPLFGWLADRIGGGRSFALLALFQILPWLALVMAGADMPLLLLLSFAIGLCCNGILTLFGVTMGDWLGQSNLALGMGLCYLLQIPFMFAAAPLAGAMFDNYGSYTPTILLHVATFAAVGAIFLFYRPARLGKAL